MRLVCCHPLVLSSLTVRIAAWFQTWSDQHFRPFVNRIEREVGALRGNVATLQGDVTMIKRNVTTLMIRDCKVGRLLSLCSTILIQASQDRNSELLVDDNGPWYEVPFPDGRMPWGLHVPLPNGRV